MVSEEGYTNIVSSRAQKEIISSWNWYEEKQYQLGDRFVEEVLEIFKYIEQYPERQPVVYKSYRELRMKVFPFIVIYRMNKKRKMVRIVSVFHTSRNPKRKY